MLDNVNSRLYYQFRPDYYFWIMVILSRKLLIAFTSLMFNKNPAFQMSFALLFLFICYALQVRVANRLCGGCVCFHESGDVVLLLLCANNTICLRTRRHHGYPSRVQSWRRMSSASSKRDTLWDVWWACQNRCGASRTCPCRTGRRC